MLQRHDIKDKKVLFKIIENILFRREFFLAFEANGVFFSFGIFYMSTYYLFEKGLLYLAGAYFAFHDSK